MKPLLRFVYRSIPFKKELFTALKSIWTPGEAVYKHLHFTQPFTVTIDSQRSFKIYNGTQIENEIFWNGLTGKWERESIKLWIELCSFSKHIFDIGANTGVYALMAKAVNPNAQVYAFEPHPSVFQSLQKNIALNQFDIVGFQQAVSNFDGKITIEDYTGSTASIQVDATQLDTYIAQANINGVDLLKIDVETHEPQVFEGFLNNLAKYTPTLLVEILNEEVAQQVFKAVAPYNYLYFNIDENKGIRQTDKLEKSDDFNYLICTPNVAARLGLLKTNNV